MSAELPTEESLRKCLELEWADHIQTRSQTWKALEIEAALVAGLLALDWRVESLPATTLFGFVVILVVLFGIGVLLHHREVEIRKFKHIISIEERLGLHRSGLLSDVAIPKPVSWTDAFRWRKSNTPTFMLRMHIAILLFVAIYVFARWVLRLVV